MSYLKNYFLIGILLFILYGCPEESGNELDTSLLVQNNLNDSLYITLYGKTNLSEADSTLTSMDVNLIYQYIDNTSLVIALDSLEIREFPNTFSMETIVESPIGEHLYLINVDTLEQYTPETWNRQSGMKHWYLFSLDDYESINYTLDYP